MIPKTLNATIKNGKIEFSDQTGSEIWLELNEGQDITISKDTNRRTIRQNNALHLWFEQVAQEMEESGLDMRNVIKVPLTPTPYLVKEEMWKPIQEKLFGKKSTAELNTDEVDKCYKIMSEAMARSLKISIPFPSEPDERY